MKNMILLTMTSLLVTFTSAAHAEQVIAKVSSVNQNIKSAELLDSGYLKITKVDESSQDVKLADEVAQQLIGSAQYLSGAEVLTDRHAAICMMMMPSFKIQNLYVADKATGDLKMALSTQSCAIATYVHPKETYMLQSAQTLRSQLLVLATQFAQ